MAAAKQPKANSGNTSDEKEKKGEKLPAISVVSRPDSFRRCGRVFTREPVVIFIEDLKEGEMTALEEETMLVVTEIELEA